MNFYTRSSLLTVWLYVYRSVDEEDTDEDSGEAEEIEKKEIQLEEE